MILGIIGVVFAFIPFVGPFIAIPCILVGLPLSVAGFVKNRRRGLGAGRAIAGMVCNGVAIIVAITSITITAVAVNEIDEALSGNTGPSNNPSRSVSRSTPATTNGNSPTIAADATRAATGGDSSTVTPTTTPEPELFGGDSSNYEVGVDIVPGKYRTAGPARSEWGPCIFARLKTAGASLQQFDQVLDVQQIHGWGLVVIEPTDGGFFTQNCREWTPVAVQSSATAAPTVEGSTPVPEPTIVRLPLGQYNPPTAEQHAIEQNERRLKALYGATPEPPWDPPKEPGSRAGKPIANSFRDGYWSVGGDIRPGVYETNGPPVGRQTEYPCTFARLRTLDGKIDDPEAVIEIVDIWLPPQRTQVTIKPSDAAVYSSNCRSWRLR